MGTGREGIEEEAGDELPNTYETKAVRQHFLAKIVSWFLPISGAEIDASSLRRIYFIKNLNSE